MYNFLSISSYRHISGTGLCEILFQTLHNGYTDMIDISLEPYICCIMSQVSTVKYILSACKQHYHLSRGIK